MTEELGIPIGLIDSTWWGTRIEAWSSWDALAKCGDTTDDSWDDENGKTHLFNAMVNPYLNMAIKGVTWYQGMHKLMKGK